VPLPFSRETYEEDFPASIDDFRQLLAQASARGEIVELHGSRDASDEAYLAVGRFVLHNSDLMIAIWDGAPARGVGGTGDVVAEASGRGVPVIHIRLDAPHEISLIAAANTSPADYSREALAAAMASTSSVGRASFSTPVSAPSSNQAAVPITLRDKHLFGAGPKRILSLDGGGVRGALSIAFLERLEDTISEMEGRPTLLGDWFDLIGGTSTGAIIACALALGYRAADVRAFYEKLGPSVFKRNFLRIAGLRAKFDSRRLIKRIEAIVGDRTLDSPDIRTGLGIVTKRLDTGSAWVVLNNPRSRYWETPADGSFIGNRHYPLVNLLRASTAAPHYFDPEPISIIKGETPGIFVDGGVSPHNNPALQLFLIAAIPQYGFSWPIGAENMTIVSVGTGSFRATLTLSQLPVVLRNVGMSMHALASQINDAQQLVMMLMTWVGQCPISWPVNSELGDMGAVAPPGGTPLFRFLRYDVRLEADWLTRELGVNVDERTLSSYRRLDEPKNIPALYELGRRAAEKQILREHLTASAMVGGASAGMQTS
jgi:hypothetical protein